MKYRLNLVREIQQQQRAAETRRVRLVGLTAFCFGALFVALFYALLQALTMQASIQEEKARLTRLKAEYQHYRASKMIVNKSDVELLDKLQKSRIFWTRKLVPMARYLPDNYWITKFGYEQKMFSVVGYGYISPRQEQLITLDDYLNNLRADSLYKDVFTTSYLKSTVRTDEGFRERVSFEYVSLSRGTNQQ